jgi:cytosine deaminase
MGSYNDAYASKLFRLLGLSKISFIANPLVNIHLQGRFDSYPKRRGLTRVKELLQAGLNVCFGHDDIVDPWYPLGTSNLLQVLHMGLHVCQLMGLEDLSNSLRLITSHSARALALGDDYGLEVGRPANLIVLDARDDYEAVRRQSAVLYSVRRGKVIAQTRPARAQILLGGAPLDVDFQHLPTPR